MMLQKGYFFRKMKDSIKPTKGYVDTDILVAYHKEAEGMWIASDLRTGLLIERGKTRKEVIDLVANKKLADFTRNQSWKFKEVILEIWSKYVDDYIFDDKDVVKAWLKFNFGIDK